MKFNLTVYEFGNSNEACCIEKSNTHTGTFSVRLAELDWNSNEENNHVVW